MKATKHTRWHYYDQAGNKIIRKFPIDAHPDLPWIRGTGPHLPEVRKKIVDNLMKHIKGKPKPDDVKLKMSLAKLGKPHKPEHCANISNAFARRRKEKQERIVEAYRLAEELGKEYYGSHNV